MGKIDYSPRELLSLLDLWDDFVGTRDVEAGKAPQPRYYHLQIANGEKLAEARTAAQLNRTKGEELLSILSETAFSDKAQRIIESTRMKEAVMLLLQN